jgi:uncharacterized membrane protein
MLMRRTILFLVGGLLLGGIIHIAVVFMVPYYATRDAWAQMDQFGPDDRFHVLPLPQAGSEPLRSLDPWMLHAVCRFSLASDPVRITAVLPDDFWSIAIFDRRGRNMYSLNDRSAERTRLDLAVVTPVQMAQLRQDPPASLDTAIVIELPLEEGFALLRVFVADETRYEAAAKAVQTADCAGTL